MEDVIDGDLISCVLLVETQIFHLYLNYNNLLHNAQSMLVEAVYNEHLELRQLFYLNQNYGQHTTIV